MRFGSSGLIVGQNRGCSLSIDCCLDSSIRQTEQKIFMINCKSDAVIVCTEINRCQIFLAVDKGIIRFHFRTVMIPSELHKTLLMLITDFSDHFIGKIHVFCLNFFPGDRRINGQVHMIDGKCGRCCRESIGHLQQLCVLNLIVVSAGIQIFIRCNRCCGFHIVYECFGVGETSFFGFEIMITDCFQNDMNRILTVKIEEFVGIDGNNLIAKGNGRCPEHIDDLVTITSDTFCGHIRLRLCCRSCNIQ